jgi:hypothetical protein
VTLNGVPYNRKIKTETIFSVASGLSRRGKEALLCAKKRLKEIE